MFDGFLNCELGMFGSIQKNHNLVDYQKTFYSAATFNPTYPNHKDPVTNSWDGITTASQITNPLAWMEVQDDDATSHISTHARLTFNLLEELKLYSSAPIPIISWKIRNTSHLRLGERSGLQRNQKARILAGQYDADL